MTTSMKDLATKDAPCTGSTTHRRTHPDPASSRTELAKRLTADSAEMWGEGEEVALLGRNETFREAQNKLLRFSKISRPVLITGESGVGKEEFARSLYLLTQRRGQPFVSVNCAQYRGEDLLVSELFGHKEGSFTWADYTRDGLFASAEGGILFLDEVGELSLKAQGMLLRAVSEGKISRIGESRERSVDVRVVEATNRNLREMVRRGEFREDLYYRLCHFEIHLPPLRERGDDWRLIGADYLNTLNRQHQTNRRLSPQAVEVLDDYAWPGNVRELRGIFDIGYCMADGDWIEPEHFRPWMREEDADRDAARHQDESKSLSLYWQMVREGGTFWKVIRPVYLDRDLNRSQVKQVVGKGLRETNGSYKGLLSLFNVTEDEYSKFMDFLRHHDLKPEAY